MIDKGGLQYTINIDGNFDTRINNAVEKIKALKGELASLSSQVGTASGTGKGKGNTASLSAEEKILKKIKDLRSEITNKAVQGAKAVLAVEKRIERSIQAQLALQSKSISGAKLEADAITQISTAEQKRLTDKKAIAVIQARGVQDEKALADAAGITVKRLRELEPAYQKAAIKQKELEESQKRATAEAKRLLKVAEKEALVREKISAQDAKRSALSISKSEDSSRKAELASLKQTILEREKLRKYNDLDLHAQQQVDALRRSDQIALKKINILRSQGVKTQREAAETLGISAQQMKRIGIRMVDINSIAKNFLFTFRRLVGILAIFTAARKFAQALGLAVKEMVTFNAELETAQISIATIITSVGRVRDAQGQLVTGADAFTAALESSDVVLNQLKEDAVGSIATFEALVKAYQVAIGPGLAAGLDLDQIKSVSNSLAEGAIRMGIPINQLSEEIRSLLKGTATDRNTRLAVLFGGAKEANEAIKNAKEQGNLYEVLTEKLQGIADGALASATSFDVLKANLQDTTSILLQQGGVSLFEELKQSMAGLSAAIRGTSDEEVFSPEALGLVQEIAGAIAEVASSFRELTDTERVLSFLRNALGTVGDVLKAIAPLASAVFQGLIDGINTVLGPIRLLGLILREIARALGLQKVNKAFAEVAKLVVQIVVATFLWRKLLIGIQALVGASGLLKSFKSLVTAVLIMGNVLKGQGISLLSINGLTAIWGVLMDNVALSTVLASGGLTLILGVLAVVVVKFGILDKLLGSFNTDIDDASKSAADLANSIESAGSATAEGARSAKEWKDEIEELIRSLEATKAVQGLTGDAKKLGDEIAKGLVDLKKQTKEYDESIASSVAGLKELKQELKGLGPDPDAGKVFELETDNLLNPDTLEEAQMRLIDFQNRVAQGIVPSGEVLVDDRAEITNKILALETAVKEQEAARAEIVQNGLTAIQLRLDILKAEKFEGEQIGQQAIDLAKVDVQISRSADARIGRAAKELGILEARNKLSQAEIDLERDRRSASIVSLYNLLRSAEVLKETAAAEEIRDTAEKQRQAILEEINDAKEYSEKLTEKENVLLKKGNDELARRKGIVAGNISDILAEISDQFDPAPLGEQIVEIVTGALTDVSSVVGDVFKDAIDPRTDADLKTAFGEFFLDLAGQFVEASTSQLVAGAVAKLGLGTVENTDQVANTAATSANTLALGALTSAIYASALGDNVSVGVDGAGSIFSGLFAASTGGAVPKGYASGGSIASIPRPANIPASDTVPAWLTPGEFVIQKSAVDSLGLKALNALNRGFLTPESFIPARRHVRTSASSVRGFATGGAVGSTSTPRKQSRTRQPPVTPVLVASENTFDQMVAGGQNSFNGNVNKVDIIGDPNKSKNW